MKFTFHLLRECIAVYDCGICIEIISCLGDIDFVAVFGIQKEV